jgi:hypothetical protein
LSDERMPDEPAHATQGATGATGATLTCAAGITPVRLSAWRDGLLPTHSAEWLATHVASCPACSARLRDYDQIGVALRRQAIPRPAGDPWPAMQRFIARTSERQGRRRLRLPRGSAWGGLGALVAAALLIALFAGLLAHQASLRPTAGATPTLTQATATPTTHSAAWTTVPGYQGLYGLAVAPSDPRVAYQLWNDLNGGPLMLRRTDDQGVSWHALTLPYIAHADYPVIIGAWSHFVTNPLDARVVYLDIYATMQAPITTCSSNAGGQNSPKSPLCLYQYLSVDGGEHWSLLSLPVVGSVSVLQAQSEAGAQPSSRIYGVISALGKDSRLARSDDGGLSWQLIDAPILATGQSVAEYSATPTASTIFALSEPAGTQPGTFPALTIWRSDDAGATWTNLGQAPSISGYSMQAAMVVNSGKPLLYLVTTATSYSGPETIQGSLFGDSGSFLTAPDTTPRCTADNGSEFVGARADGSVIAWCGGALQSWLATPARAQNSGWRTLTQDPATSSVQTSFMQTLPDGSTRLWLVTEDNKGAKVEYATLPN